MPENRLYSKENMFVISSYAERCLMSAQSFLAGFMPPLKQQNPLPIPWQPIAVNSIPRNQDRVSSTIWFSFSNVENSNENISVD